MQNSETILNSFVSVLSLPLGLRSDTRLSICFLSTFLMAHVIGRFCCLRKIMQAERFFACLCDTDLFQSRHADFDNLRQWLSAGVFNETHVI